MNDEQIIEMFFNRSEDAICELSQKYGNVCMKVSMSILNNRQDAEECVNDSYLGVWNAIPPQKPDSLIAFLCRIVKNLSIKRYVHNSADKRKSNYGTCIEELSECIPSLETVDSEFDMSELSKTIDLFLDTLNKQNRLLFVRRYWFSDSCEDLARITGMKEQAVRTRLSRIRSKLKDFLYEKGVSV